MLRILTGVIIPDAAKRTGGEAKVEFNGHQVTGPDATGSHLETTGAAGRFSARPGKVVSMREFVVQDRRKHSQDSTISDPFRINDIEWDRDHLKVEWSCESGAQIVEITYLIVGEVCECK